MHLKALSAAKIKVALKLHIKNSLKARGKR